LSRTGGAKLAPIPQCRDVTAPRIGTFTCVLAQLLRKIKQSGCFGSNPDPARLFFNGRTCGADAWSVVFGVM